MVRYALRPGVLVYKDSNDDVRTFSPALGEVRTFQGFHGDEELMQSLQDPKSLSELHEDLTLKGIRVTKQELKQALDALIQHSVVESIEDPMTVVDGLSAFFQDLDPVRAAHAIEQLNQSAVLVIGVGTVGSTLSVLLSQIGIGSLILVDADEVEVKNLKSQLAYSLDDVGKKKAYVLAEFIRKRSDTRVYIEDRKVTSREDISEILLKYVVEKGFSSSMIVNCADEPSVDAIATWIEDAVNRLKIPIPFIAGGGYAGHMGSIGPTIIPNKTASWASYWKQVEELRSSTFGRWRKIASRPRGDHARPVFAPLGAFVSSLLAKETVWVLTGINAPMFAGCHVEWNVRNGEFMRKPIRES